MNGASCIDASGLVSCIMLPTAVDWTLLGSDVINASVYIALPALIIYVARRRSDFLPQPVMWLSCTSSLFMGLHFFIAVIAHWHPYFYASAIVSLIGACAAVATIGAFLKTLPELLHLPDRINLQNTILHLENEIRAHKKSEVAMRVAHDQLENRIEEHTTELHNRNQQLIAEIIEHNRVEAALRETQLILNSAQRLALSNAGFNQQKIAADLLALLAENHPFPCSAMFRPDRRSDQIKCIASHGMPLDGFSYFQFPNALLLTVAHSGQTKLVACTDRTKASLQVSEQIASDQPALMEAMIVPVMYQDQCMMVLVVASTRSFTAADTSFIESLRVQLGVAQHNLRLYAGTKRLANELHTRNLEIAEKNCQLQDISRIKSEFVANMSHELRTPLNAVLGFTGTLLMRLPGPLTADQDKQLRTIQSSARHLLSLINDLLDVEKIESGKVDIRLERVVLQTIVREVFDTLQPLAAQKNLEFRVSLPQANIAIHTDRRALSQILINLINNAIKFTDRGYIAVRLSRRRIGHFGTVELTVADTGIGILPERQAELFQAFTQVDTSSTRRFEGSGLGLYLSRRLAVMIGARLDCKSEYGKGSVFILALPVQKT
jgi:signal transduction histidine kinase